jgi:hypothetical protein
MLEGIVKTSLLHNTSDVIDFDYRTNPVLASLGNYGGPTQTMPPLPGSPAIDAGDDAVTNFLATDQRGLPRLQGAHVDIGAVEVNTNAFVTTNANSGPGSLRNAVASAAPGDAVLFASSLSGQVITLTSGQIVLSNSITIDASSLANPLLIGGNDVSRIFSISSGASVTLKFLYLNVGYASNSYGGALSNSPGATVLLSQCYVANSTADIYGGGIVNSGTMTLLDCTVALNFAGQYGGGINNDGTLFVNNSTVANNTASIGGGGISSGGQVTLTQATVSANTAGSLAGGIHNGGSLALYNSILAGNSAPSDTDYDNSYGGETNQVGGSPGLAALGSYGGPAPTMPPLPGSPVINAGNDGIAASFATDERGYPRIAGARVDLGAAEGVYITTSIGKLTNVTVLSDGSIQFAFTNITDANLPVLATTNLALPLSEWTQIGFATNDPAGSAHYQFTDPQATVNDPQRFYLIRSF